MKKFRLTALVFICLLFSMTFSITAFAVTKPARVTNLKVTTRSASIQVMTWTPVSGAKGYQIYCKDYSKSSPKYARVRTVVGTKRKTCLIAGRKPGVVYKYSIRAYKVVKGKYYFGRFSPIVKSYIPKSTPAASPTPATPVPTIDSSIITNPSTAQKYKKIFGDSSLSMRYPGGYYTASSQAVANMMSITVKTWDFASGRSGAKITRTWTIQVHKNIASTVQQIFAEIYAGSEKFPIHELGGYAWRGGHSEHNTGTALDINWSENYMVNVATGVITAGYYWKPGVDPYSIPKDGEVARIFKKYGFSQGDWGNSKDYMHFSYFGT